ncbi:MAG: hypothetical protein ACE5FA_06950 [Dehalococcoidia bacterium]
MSPLLALLTLLILAACSGGGDESISGSGNLFDNAGFEEGADPWFTLNEDSGFEVSKEFARSGEYSAILRMDDPVSAEGARVYYLVQELEPEGFPEVVEGFYRVENWGRGTDRQYVQVVIIAMEPENFPADIASNFQLRYVLAGLDVDPFENPDGPVNARMVFVSRDEPVQGEWVEFRLNVREDFERLWDRVPEGFDRLRLLFEVRWDAKPAGDGAPRGDVYYDDLYIGEG